MITTILFTVAGTAAVLEGGPHVWRFVTTHKPRLAEQLLALERQAADEIKPIASTVEKEISDVLTQVEQDALSAVKALVDGKKAVEAEAADLNNQLAAKQAEVDAANANATNLQSQLDAEKADHADLVSQLQGVLNPAPAA